MALQIRRGTEAERLTITPAEGELIYTTDTKILYVGDGATIGGTKADTGILSLAEDTTPQLGGSLDLNSQNITGVGNINNSGNITASGVVSAASGNFTSASIGAAEGNFKGTFAADDSTLLIDGISGKVNLAPNSIDDIGDVSVPAPNNGDVLQWDGGLLRWVAGSIGDTGLTGNFTGSFFADDSSIKIDGISGEVYGPFTGDLKGSVFADDSTVLIDGVASLIVGDITNTTTRSEFVEVLRTDDTGTVKLTRESNIDISSDSVFYGQILFERADPTGNTFSSWILGGRDGVYIANEPDGNIVEANYTSITSTGLAIGTFAPDPTFSLDVRGNAQIVGNMKAAAFTGTYTADDSTIIVDGIDKSANLSTVTASSFVQVGGITTAERDNLTAANGMIIYNTSVNKFQGYENGAWANLI